MSAENWRMNSSYNLCRAHASESAEVFSRCTEGWAKVEVALGENVSQLGRTIKNNLRTKALLPGSKKEFLSHGKRILSSQMQFLLPKEVLSS